MDEIELSLDDFRDYFKSNSLGELHLPNGSCKISLASLYDNLASWKINDKTLSVDDLVAVIAIGSAVRYPGYTERTITTKKYLFFGPPEKRIRKIPIEPNDVDFLILTRENMTKEKVIPAFKEDRCINDYGNTASAIVCNEMHLVCRGANQMLVGANYRSGTLIPIDSVSEHTLREGVPLFYNKTELEHLLSRSSVKKETPRKVFWKDSGNKLVGRIK